MVKTNVKLFLKDYLYVSLFFELTGMHFWGLCISLTLIFNVFLSFFFTNAATLSILLSFLVLFLFKFVFITLSARRAKKYPHLWEWEISDERVSIKIGPQSATLNLHDIKKVVSMKRYFVVFPDKLSFYILPKRVLKAEEIELVKKFWVKFW